MGKSKDRPAREKKKPKKQKGGKNAVDSKQLPKKAQ